MRSKQYESDKTRIILVRDISQPDQTEEFYATEDGEGGWDSRPESIVWSADDSKLFVSAEHRGRRLIFQLPSDPAKATALPEVVETTDGSVAAFHLLASSSSSSEEEKDQLLVTTSSFIDNSCYSISSPSSSPKVVSSASKLGKSFGLCRSQISSITFSGGGAGDYTVHAHVIRPSTYDKTKKYPLAMLIHGGPQNAWLDAWSTRWNPAVFAEQGYVVVCPNPTGSTGYGQALEDAIAGDWGGRPYEDLVKCFEYVEKNMPEVDTSRAVALGASYGGFMISENSPLFFFSLFSLNWGWPGWMRSGVILTE
jgi:dipeptidyl aminopeptidase/acylaminoacyl peptidase